MTLFGILILSHNKEGVDISMRKDIIIEKIMSGGEKCKCQYEIFMTFHIDIYMI